MATKIVFWLKIFGVLILLISVIYLIAQTFGGQYFPGLIADNNLSENDQSVATEIVPENVPVEGVVGGVVEIVTEQTIRLVDQTTGDVNEFSLEEMPPYDVLIENVETGIFEAKSWQDIIVGSQTEIRYIIQDDQRLVQSIIVKL